MSPRRQERMLATRTCATNSWHSLNRGGGPVAPWISGATGAPKVRFSFIYGKVKLKWALLKIHFNVADASALLGDKDVCKYYVLLKRVSVLLLE